MDLQEFYLGLQVTVVGMGVVFAALYFLQLVMYGLRAAFYREAPRPAPAVVPTAAPETQAEPPADDAAQGLPAALIAAISVAVASYMQGRPGSIVAIRRATDGKTPWQHAARVSPMENRRS